MSHEEKSVRRLFLILILWGRSIGFLLTFCFCSDEDDEERNPIWEQVVRSEEGWECLGILKWNSEVGKSKWRRKENKRETEKEEFCKRKVETVHVCESWKCIKTGDSFHFSRLFSIAPKSSWNSQFLLLYKRRCIVLLNVRTRPDIYTWTFKELCLETWKHFSWSSMYVIGV